MTDGQTIDDLKPEPIALILTENTDPAWVSHHQFETERPRDGAMARESENTRRAEHARQCVIAGVVTPFRPSRAFPCPGVLRFHDRTHQVWLAQCDRCGYEVGVNRDRIDREHLVSQRMKRADLPRMFRGQRWLDARAGGHDEQTGAARAVRWWVEHSADEARHAPPLLYGGPGRGKTHLLTLAAETLIKRYLIDVWYLPVLDLVAKAREQAGRASVPAGTPGVLDRAVDVPVLVLDDLGAERVTEFTAELLDTLIDRRFRLGHPILAATNLEPGELPNAVGDRAASRLVGMTEPVMIGGPDWRQTGRAEGQRLTVLRGGKDDPPADRVF